MYHALEDVSGICDTTAIVVPIFSIHECYECHRAMACILCLYLIKYVYQVRYICGFTIPYPTLAVAMRPCCCTMLIGSECVWVWQVIAEVVARRPCWCTTVVCYDAGQQGDTELHKAM